MPADLPSSRAIQLGCAGGCPRACNLAIIKWKPCNPTCATSAADWSQSADRQAYGVGGYYGTPLEDALPVDMQIKDEKRRPSLDIVFIIDHSGSMGETSGGVTKLELAKEAAARSIELLFPN